MSSLLNGVRVLDVTTVLAGPFATYQLGLLGADVVKIEIPGTGDLARDMGDDEYLRSHAMGAAFVAQNAGKRSLVLDLKSEEGRDAFTRLVGGADVLVENMRPGVLARLGFDSTRLAEINPRLVYCAVSGFGADGPLAGRPAFDQIIQGFSGMNDVTGVPEGEPTRIGFPVCDTLGGYAAAMAVAAALVRVAREGVGAYLDVSMLDVAITAMGWVVSETLITRHYTGRLGNDNAASAPSGTFHTGDGLLNIAANAQYQFESVCAVLDRRDLLEDPRFATRELRKAHRAELTRELEAALASRSAREWEEALAAESVPAGRVLSLPEVLEHEQIRTRELVHEIVLDLPQRATASVVGSAVRVDGGTLAPSGPPPRLGEHGAEILREVGYRESEIEVLRRDHVI